MFHWLGSMFKRMGNFFGKWSRAMDRASERRWGDKRHNDYANRQIHRRHGRF